MDTLCTSAIQTHKSESALIRESGYKKKASAQRPAFFWAGFWHQVVHQIYPSIEALVIWAGIAPAWVGLYIPHVILWPANDVKRCAAFDPALFHQALRLAGMEKSKKFRARARNWHQVGIIPRLKRSRSADPARLNADGVHK